MVIDEQVIYVVAGDTCSGETCTYIHLPATSLTAPPPVAVDVVGCTIQRLSPKDISSCKSIASFVPRLLSGECVPSMCQQCNDP